LKRKETHQKFDKAEKKGNDIVLKNIRMLHFDKDEKASKNQGRHN